MKNFTILKLSDVEDLSGDYAGEVKMLKNPLGTEQVAITYRRLAPDSGSIRGSRRGHRHKTQEEVIVVLAGTITFKLEDKRLKLGPWQVIRIATGTAQDMWNEGADEAELLIISTRIEDLMADLELIQDYWDKPQSGKPDYTVVDIAEIKDISGDYPGEMKFLKDPLGTTQVALSFRRMPQHTGSKGSYGHRHARQEEIIFVRSGTLQVKISDTVHDIGPNTFVRIAPGTTQGSWNNQPEDVHLLIISNRMEPEDDARTDRDFWPAD